MNMRVKLQDMGAEGCTLSFYNVRGEFEKNFKLRIGQTGRLSHTFNTDLGDIGSVEARITLKSVKRDSVILSIETTYDISTIEIEKESSFYIEVKPGWTTSLSKVPKID